MVLRERLNIQHFAFISLLVIVIVVTPWEPEDGRRHRSRTRKRWRDDLKAFMMDWSERT